MSTDVADLRELLVDGVRVFHLPRPGKTRAALFFGVGWQDESFATSGVTHLVEHLAMAQLPKSHLEANASVTVDHTVFSANGRPEQVGDFLRRVCTALTDLPLGHLDREKGVVLTELAGKGEAISESAWSVRYGLAGPGLGSTGWHGPLAITGEEVLAHATSHFTAGRAALAVLGPLPDAMTLPLRTTPASADGAPARRFPQPRRAEGPEWVQAPTGGVALVLDGLDPLDAAVRVASTVLCLRLEAVERSGDLAFSVVSHLMDGLDGDVFTVTVDAGDPGDSTNDEVASLVWEQLADLATNGPTPEELDHVLAGFAAELDLTDPDVVDDEPFRRGFAAAAAAATGRGQAVPLVELAVGAARTTPEDVRDRLASAARHALLVVPLETELSQRAQEVGPITHGRWCEELPYLPEGRRLRPPLLRRLFNPFLRRTLVLTDEAAVCRDQTGEVHEVRWDEVAGVVELRGSDPGVIVISRTKCSISVHPRYYGQAVFDDVVRRLAPHVERLRRCQRAHELAERSAEVAR